MTIEQYRGHGQTYLQFMFQHHILLSLQVFSFTLQLLSQLGYIFLETPVLRLHLLLLLL